MTCRISETSPTGNVSKSTSSVERGIATLEGTALALGLSAPDSGVLAGLQGPFQTDFCDLASTADRLGLIGLEKRKGIVPVREEQFGAHRIGLSLAGGDSDPSKTGPVKQTHHDLSALS
jgi:hypothetical protein